MTAKQSGEVLGRLLRNMREAAGGTRAQVIAATGITKGHVSNIESGRDMPSWFVVAYYEDEFAGDGQAWSVFVEVSTGQKPPQRRAGGSVAKYPLPGDESGFIGDVTIPDGLVIRPLERFVKTWRIQNTGSVPWIGRRLAREGAAAGMGIPASPAFVAIPDTEPGVQVDVSVPITASPVEGTAQIRWKMVDPAGDQYFPDRYWYGLMMTVVIRKNAPPLTAQPMLPPLPNAP